MIEDHKLLFENIGITLLSCQIAERSLKECLSWQMPMEFMGTLDDALTISSKINKKPFGILKDTLKENFKVDDKFCNFLSEFIKRRNQFAHNLRGIIGDDFNSPEGIKVGLEYTCQLGHDAMKLFSVFHAFRMRYAESANPKEYLESIGFYSGNDDLRKQVDAWKPYLDAIIESKN